MVLHSIARGECGGCLPVSNAVACRMQNIHRRGHKTEWLPGMSRSLFLRLHKPFSLTSAERLPAAWAGHVTLSAVFPDSSIPCLDGRLTNDVPQDTNGDMLYHTSPHYSKRPRLTRIGWAAGHVSFPSTAPLSHDAYVQSLATLSLYLGSHLLWRACLVEQIRGWHMSPY